MPRSCTSLTSSLLSAAAARTLDAFSIKNADYEVVEKLEIWQILPKKITQMKLGLFFFVYIRPKLLYLRIRY